jgi:hypothetical protein
MIILKKNLKTPFHCYLQLVYLFYTHNIRHLNHYQYFIFNGVIIIQTAQEETLAQNKMLFVVRGLHCFHPVYSSFIKSLYVQLPLYFKREFLKTWLIFLVFCVMSVLFVFNNSFKNGPIRMQDLHMEISKLTNKP